MSWEERSINSITEIVTKGTTPSTYGYNFIKEGVNYIRAEAISKDGRIKEDTFLKISSDCHEKLKRSQLKSDDILFSIAGMALGKTGIVKGNYLPANTNQAVAIIRPIKELINPRFLQFQFINPNFYELVNKFSAQAAQPNINLTQLKSLSILAPPLQTQKRIADILSAYDDLIENNLKRVKLLEQAAQNIYKEWFVNMRFPGHENTPINEETGLPEGWGYGVVSDLCEVKSGYAFKSKQWKKEGNPVIKIKNINNNTVSLNDSGFVDDEVADVAKKYELFTGDVVIAMTGATVGKVGLMPKIDKRIYLNQRVGLFRPLSEENDNIALVFSFFLTDDSQQQVLNFAQGAAQPNISGSEIGNIKLNIADSKVLSEFNKLTKPSIDLIQTLYGQNQKLKAARDILLPRLMNRTIEV